MEHVIVDKFGAFVGKKSERLVIREEGKVVSEIPFADVEQLTITSGGVSLSTDAIRECVEHGIQINFLSGSGNPYAKITSPSLSGTVITRREQVLAYNDRRGVHLSCAFVEGKVRNQTNVLKYFAKHRRTADREVYEKLYDAARKMEDIGRELDGIKGDRIDEVRGLLLAIEGRAANHYWQMVQEVLLDKIDFPGRERRGATDPLNSMLNYAYGILYQQIWGAVMLAGLEPFAGFLHVDRPGKPSLVLDFIEEFRAQVVDRTVIAMVSRGFRPEMEEDRLSQATRRELAERILERLDAEERYESKKHRLRTVIQRQARHIATFLRGEGNYRPFIGGW